MSDRGDGRRSERLGRRLALLREVVAAAPGRIPDDLAARARGTLAQADARLAHGTSHTVVAIAGATGSGKSSLFNALVERPLAEVGVRRPTTATAQAAVFGGGAEALLDWVGVPRRHVVPGGDLDGLVLLDLPDHDSFERTHRDEVDRLLEVVDAFVWVVDPQKYADDALHSRYLTRFAAHGAVSIVVLNQLDVLAGDAERRAVVEHLGRLLADDGLGGVRIVGTSATRRDGVEPLRRELVARVAERQALVARLDADLDHLVDDLRAAVGDATPTPLGRGASDRLVRAFSFAAGIDAVADAVGAAHRHRSARHGGWPPVRWVGQLRPDPLRRLGLDRLRPAGADAPVDGPPPGGRSSRPRPTAVAEAAVDEALRRAGADAGEALPEAWGRRLDSVATGRRADVADALDVAVSSAEMPTGSPRWWGLASGAQWAATVAMVAGLAWLAAIGVVAWLRLPELPTPDVGPLAVPTVLALGGAAVGLLIAGLARRAAAVGAGRRAARARRRLEAATAEVAHALVVGPLDAELAAMAQLQALVRRMER